jgi:hypothetical protein
MTSSFLLICRIRDTSDKGVYPTHQTMLGERPPDALQGPLRHAVQFSYPLRMLDVEPLGTLPNPARVLPLDSIVPLSEALPILLNRPFLLGWWKNIPELDPSLGKVFGEKFVVSIIAVLETQDG